jgi:hypothetical protein
MQARRLVAPTLMKSVGGRHSRECMRSGLDVVRVVGDDEIIADNRCRRLIVEEARSLGGEPKFETQGVAGVLW